MRSYSTYITVLFVLRIMCSCARMHTAGRQCVGDCRAVGAAPEQQVLSGNQKAKVC